MKLVGKAPYEPVLLLIEYGLSLCDVAYVDEEYRKFSAVVR